MWSNSIKRACCPVGRFCIKVVKVILLSMSRIVTVVIETCCEVFSPEPAPVATPEFVASATPVAQRVPWTPNRSPQDSPPGTPAASSSPSHARATTSIRPVPTSPAAQLGAPRNAHSALGPSRAQGCRIQLVIVYLVVIALLKSVGIGWVPVITSIARDFLKRCRALQEPLARALNKLCQRFPSLQTVRGVLAYAMGLETGEALWHQLIHKADSGIESLWELLSHYIDSCVMSGNITYGPGRP
jgi:hypothetical protein